MTRTPTTFASVRTHPAALIRSARAKALPIALAGGLLIFGVRGVAAAEDAVPINQFTVGGQTITVQGNYTAKMVGGSLDVTAPNGPAELQLGPNQVIDLNTGDEVVLSSLSDGTINSIGIDVVTGQAVLVPVTHTIDDATGDLITTPNGDGTILSPMSSVSVGIGPDGMDSDSDSISAPTEATIPISDGSGGD